MVVLKVTQTELLKTISYICLTKIKVVSRRKCIVVLSFAINHSFQYRWASKSCLL